MLFPLRAAVEPADGESVAADAVLWTGGARVAPLAAAARLAVEEHGRILTDAALRSVSHPDVYAVGDAAVIRRRYGVMHGTPPGRHADRGARRVAREHVRARRTAVRSRQRRARVHSEPARHLNTRWWSDL